MKKLLLFSIVAVLLTVTVSAQRAGDRLQKHSIRQGFRSGQLTRPERFELRKDRVRYHRMDRRAHRDGVVTPIERRRLHHKKTQNRREVFRYKHNRHRRVL
jgi:hypothetical protein